MTTSGTPSPTRASVLRDLPDLYQRLLPEWFRVEAPVETRATCADCAMCDTQAPPHRVAFEPNIKCCSYWPALPNYLVGGVFADPRPELEEGRQRLRERIAGRIAIQPGWVAAPVRYRLLSRAARHDAFGRSESLLCPYYARDNGRCTVWAYREGVCSTFFCKYDAGERGQRFWRVVRDVLSAVEVALSAWSIRQVAGRDLRGLPLSREWLTRHELEERPPSDADYADWWGEWVGREETFYRRCWDAVSGFDPAELGDLIREDRLRKRFEDAQEALNRTELPPALELNPDMRRWEFADGSVELNSYNAYDTHVMPAPVWTALQVFGEGASIDEGIAHAARQGVTLTEELLRGLVEFDVLLPKYPPPE